MQKRHSLHGRREKDMLAPGAFPWIWRNTPRLWKPLTSSTANCQPERTRHQQHPAQRPVHGPRGHADFLPEFPQTFPSHGHFVRHGEHPEASTPELCIRLTRIFKRSPSASCPKSAPWPPCPIRFTGPQGDLPAARLYLLRQFSEHDVRQPGQSLQTGR